ncbi:hypothetical protein [Paludibacterium purpuratum]|uniref:Uncharacterized protein n=1 Tax=Paludibacterium purpuratum TaxID=1144873 RepID=A0A4R7AZY0_9NEIS|nr:hypothetical protein [Paludibacterium purpuratum]TDR72514.1 hypothetical protein DFP86_11679 [Paludibacterium purpuratum]
MLLGLMAQGEAASTTPASGRDCASPVTQVCSILPPSSAEVSLRALRLQNAVDNGDLSPQEAQKILMNRHRIHNAHAYSNSSQPMATTPPTGSGHRNRFWREERRRMAPADPTDPN